MPIISIKINISILQNEPRSPKKQKNHLESPLVSLQRRFHQLKVFNMVSIPLLTVLAVVVNIILKSSLWSFLLNFCLLVIMVLPLGQQVFIFIIFFPIVCLQNLQTLFENIPGC